MFRKILIANRGEIACRIARTAREMGISTVAIYSDPDADALHVLACDEAIRIGPAALAKSYLSIDAILEACKRTGADAVHPGYGFLSENPDFVEALTDAGIAFIGPSAESIRAMGHKDAAKALMETVGVPIVPGYHGEDQSDQTLKNEAAKIGFPLLIKARAGGGGKGMRRVDLREEFNEALVSARRESSAAFGDDRMLLERFVASARHIEVQVLADHHGNAVHLHERDCSLQRRHQKVIEEAPAPGMTDALREAMGDASLRAAKAVNYTNAGTIEFLVDMSAGLRDDRFYFMEMNTRLQVEHPITEAVTGVDLVEQQILIAAGEQLSLTQGRIPLVGHAFEARIYAEDPARDFLPSIGRIEKLTLPTGTARVDSGIRQGDVVSPYFDPMLAKVIVHGATREQAIGRLGAALDATQISGTTTNIDFLRALARNPAVERGDVETALIAREIGPLTLKPPTPDIAWALGAVRALGLPSTDKDASPWAGLTGWRAWGDATHSVTLDNGSKSETIEVKVHGPRSFEVSTPGSKIDIQFPSVDGAVQIDGRIARAECEAVGAKIEIALAGDIHRFAVDDPLLRGTAADTAGDGVITAPMPGLVKAVFAAEGDTVETGDTLMILEAMKMEHPMKALAASRVDTLHVSEGDQVIDGAVLITLEQEDAAE